MQREKWNVTLEDPYGAEVTRTVEARGYSQAITYALDVLQREGVPNPYKPGAWSPIKLERVREVAA